jgi:predicted double-glycine peptidase
MAVQKINPSKLQQSAQSSAGSKSSIGQIDRSNLMQQLGDYQNKLAGIRQHQQSLIGKQGLQSPEVLADQKLESTYRSKVYELSQQIDKMAGESSSAGGDSPLEKLGKMGKSALEGVSNGLKSAGEKVSNAVNWFVSQIKGGSNTNEDAGGNNQNCGPANLLMIARKLGVMKGGPAEADAQIEKIRNLMGASSNENAPTKTSELVRGAKALGLNASYSKGNTGADVEKAWKSGKEIIAHVNPKEYGGADANHFVVVQSIDSKTVTLFDPAQQKPITISRAQFDKALSNHGGFAVQVSK